MDKIRAMIATLTALLAVLDTLAECPQGFPESTLYLALGSNYDASARLLGMLREKNAVAVSGHYVTQGPAFTEVRTNAQKNLDTFKRLCAEKGITL